MKLSDIHSSLLIILLILFITQGINADEKTVESILYNANSLEKKGKLDDAIKEYQKAIDKDKNCATAYDRLAFLYMSCGKVKEAENSAHSAIRLDPGVSISYNILGIIEEQNKNLIQAEEYYKKAIKNNPNYAKAYNNLGNIYVKSFDFPKAEQTYKEAISLDPQLAMAHNNLGYSLEMQGKLEEALKEYTKALEIEPDNQMIQNNQIRVKNKISQPQATASERKIAESICFFSIPPGFRLIQGVVPKKGGKLAVFEYNYLQRIILRELPEDNPINETLFSQMIVDYKKELIKLLEDLLNATGMKIIGQGYTDIDKRKVLYVSTEFNDQGIPMEGVFSLITNFEENRNILIMAIAKKGQYRKDITDIFLKNINIRDRT